MPVQDCITVKVAQRYGVHGYVRRRIEPDAADQAIAAIRLGFKCMDPSFISDDPARKKAEESGMCADIPEAHSGVQYPRECVLHMLFVCAGPIEFFTLGRDQDTNPTGRP